jgi:hypothetical protein
MKAFLSFKKRSVTNEHRDVVKKFIKFLQNEFPLVNDVKVVFVREKEGKMTTGGRYNDGSLFVLCGKRIMRDILRTLAHEWIHEYQMTILGRERGPDIGGENEDEANAYAGRLIKIFEKKYPQIQETMYE